MHNSPPNKQVPGGINPRVTVVDKDHPLSESDSTLAVILDNQGPQLLKRYQQAKGAHALPVAKFEPLGFSTQVVAGTNYYVILKPIFGSSVTTAQNNDKEVVHARIFYQVWTNTTQLTGFVVGKKVTDSLDHDYPELAPLPPSLEKRDGHHGAKEAMANVDPMILIR
ncbi:hypothetical protein BGZ83_009578 [Gryganskiella cystojenkinii]|nr:hypothetical protein BGZ83_009578 [Gryganskiella cystojenkinii]